MTARTSAAEGIVSSRRPSDRTIERITVALIPKAAAELQELQNRTGLSKTDIVNRAITLYEFIDEELHASRDVLVRDRKTGEIQIVRFL